MKPHPTLRIHVKEIVVEGETFDHFIISFSGYLLLRWHVSGNDPSKTLQVIHAHACHTHTHTLQKQNTD